MNGTSRTGSPSSRAKPLVAGLAIALNHRIRRRLEIALAGVATASRNGRPRVGPLAALVISAFGLMPAEPALASILTVTSCADDGSPGTLRWTIGAAGENDQVDVGELTCSVITLTQGQIEVPQADLAIEHKYHAGFQPAITVTTNISFENVAPGRILHHTGGGALSLIGPITFTYGVQAYSSSASSGGCIRSNGALTLNGVTLSHCFAEGFGGGGAVYGAKSVALTNSTIESSGVLFRYSTGGAAIYSSGPITITGSTITGNYTNAGICGYGAVFSANSVDVTNSVISGNRIESGGAANGAGITALSGLTLTQSTVSGNNAQGSGSECTLRSAGGGVVAQGTVSITNSTIDHNIGYLGAGLYLHKASATITNSTIADNIASSAGGGIISTSPVTLQNSTVAFNHAPFGGGILIDTTQQAVALTLQSSILADNIATDNASGGDLLVGGNQFSATTANSLVVASSFALPGSPLFACPRLQPLADNGGPTRTLALMHDSPAIDAGNNGAALQYDQRGNGYPRVAGMAADMGAYEWQGITDDRVFHSGYEPGCDE
jgi:hypothetical protein